MAWGLGSSSWAKWTVPGLGLVREEFSSEIEGGGSAQTWELVEVSDPKR